MRHVVRIEGEYPFDAIVETTRSAVRLDFDFHGGGDLSFLLDPTATAQLAVALQAAAWHHIGAKSGDETRGPS